MSKPRKRPMTITEFAAMGGRAAAARLTASELSARGRHAVRIRWARAKKAKTAAA